MNSTTNQRIFRTNALNQLRANLKSGHSLKNYFEQSFLLNEEDTILSTILLPGKAPTLKIVKKDPVASDLENAILLHKYYANLDEIQASDPRLWTYLSHVEFRDYTIARWGLDKSYEELKEEDDKRRAINQIFEHWFVIGNDRDLRRHAIARLWWAAHLTCAPWERDPAYFSDIKKPDSYYYTEILFQTQDIYQQVLERAMGRSSRILISILDYLSLNKGFAKSREKVRSLMKELNLAYGTRKLIILNRPELKTLIEELAKEIEITYNNT